MSIDITSTDKVLIQAHDKPLIIHFPQLDEHLAMLNAGGADPEAVAMLTAAAAVPKASTNGWDTVFAIRVPDVNSAIVKQKTSPKDFEKITTDPTYGITSSVQGTFGDWQITLGGDGQNINMRVPIKTGTFTLNKKQTSLNGGEAVIQLKLNFLPPPTKTPPTPKGTNHDLKAKLTPEVSGVPVVSVLNFVWPQGTTDPGVIADSLIKGDLQAWFNDNLKDFVQVFSAVNLNVKADTENLQWLKPTYTSYAYADPISESKDLCDALFGVLCITTSKTDPTTLRHEITSGAIPSGQRSSFLIGEQLFTREVMYPSLPASFKSATLDDFELTNNDTEIILSDRAKDKDVVELDGVKYGAITYHPYLHDYSVQVNDTEIVSTMTVKAQISPGIITYIDITTYNTLILVQKTDGTQTIGYQQTRDTKSSHRVHTSPGVIVTEVIAGIIVAVVGLVAGKLAETIGKRIIIAIIVAIIAGIITAIQEILTEVIAKGVAESMPKIDPVVQAGTDPITWPTQESQFTLTAVGLNMSVQLSGEPGFSGPDTCKKSRG